jgi:nucleotide-binding universal stress UspA family protein
VRPIIVGRHAVAEAWTPELVRDIAADARRIAGEAGCSPTVVTDIQAALDIAAAILDYAEKNQVDHMVIGSTGKGGVKQLLLGSVSAELVRRAPCPVTVVH